MNILFAFLLIPLVPLALAGLNAARRFTIAQPDPLSLIVNPPQMPRALALEGSWNVRDLGGYLTTDGRRVRYGCLYRGGALGGLTADDHQRLGALGLRAVCDLRSTQEVTAEPDHLPPGVRYQHVPLMTLEENSSQRIRRLIVDPRALQTALPESYVMFLRDSPRVFGAVILHAADANALPLLFHCTAGKDRTGLTAALILLALGVPEDVVIADYTLSNHAYPYYSRYVTKMTRRLMLFGLRLRDLRPLLVADAATLRHALDWLKSDYGSVEAYLRDCAGVDDAALARLRATLLEAV